MCSQIIFVYFRFFQRIQNLHNSFQVCIAVERNASITAIAQWTMNHVNNLITYRIVRSLRTQAFEHLQELPLSYVDRHSSGDLISRIITDIDQFSDGLLLGFTQVFTSSVTILGTIGFMLSINPWITLVVVVLKPPCPSWWPTLFPENPSPCSRSSPKPAGN